jgi:hypothetical protein
VHFRGAAAPLLATEEGPPSWLAHKPDISQPTAADIHVNSLLCGIKPRYHKIKSMRSLTADWAMAYWWVSQNQTFKHERAGEFLWAPTADSAGHTPHHWATMAQVESGDVIFSYVDQKIPAISIASRTKNCGTKVASESTWTFEISNLRCRCHTSFLSFSRFCHPNILL